MCVDGGNTFAVVQVCQSWVSHFILRRFCKNMHQNKNGGWKWLVNVLPKIFKTMRSEISFSIAVVTFRIQHQCSKKNCRTTRNARAEWNASSLVCEMRLNVVAKQENFSISIRVIAQQRYTAPRWPWFSQKSFWENVERVECHVLSFETSNLWNEN